MDYYRLVCGVHKTKDTEVGLLAIQNKGCPTGTQYLTELSNSDFRTEMIVFVSSEDAGNFVQQAYHLVGLQFYVICLEKLSRDC